MLELRDVDVLEAAFCQSVRNARWLGGWLGPRTTRSLREKLSDLCAICPEDGDQDARAKLCWLTRTMAGKISSKRGNPFSERCPLAAALRADSFEVAEELWRAAPRSWWAGGEALEQAAHGQEQALPWIERLLPHWHSKKFNDGFVEQAVSRALLKNRKGKQLHCDALWQAMAEKLSPKDAFIAATRAAGWGSGFEDWAKQSLARCPEKAGELFMAAVRYSNAEGFSGTQCGPWRGLWLGHLAREATRPQLLFAIAWPVADPIHHRVAQEELRRRGEAEMLSDDSEAVELILSECHNLEFVYGHRGLDPSQPQKIREEAGRRCSSADPLAVASRILRSAGDAGCERSLLEMVRRPWATPARSAESPRSQRLAKDISTLARGASESVGTHLRALAGLNDKAFDHYFQELMARQQSSELAAACGAPPTVSLKAKARL